MNVLADTLEEALQEYNNITLYSEDETIDYLIVDEKERKIIIPDSEIIFGVESDEKAERKYFKCPKFVGDDIDLTKLNLRIVYQNAANQKDYYLITDVKDNGDGSITFSWLLSRKVTMYKGNVAFILCAVKISSDGTIKNEWNTEYLAEATVLRGLEVEDITDSEETYVRDVISQLIEIVTSQEQEAIENIQNESDTQQKLIEQKGVEVLGTLPEEYLTFYDFYKELNSLLGTGNETVAGVQVDFENKTFKRLMGAYSLNVGDDFNKFEMYKYRRRCNLSDDGKINAWYGDERYVEDGSNGQLMVFQPKYYYKVVPLVKEQQTDGIGYHLRKVNYYISSLPNEGAGFKLHPAFINENGEEVDYIFTSAYEGNIYDVSEEAYLMLDEQVVDFTLNTGDKLCSISGVKPCSGLTQNLTRPNAENIAKNRGIGWHSDLIKIESMEQLLMLVEYGFFNMQTNLGKGITEITNNSEYNCSSLTGSTSELGNTSGKAGTTINEINGTQTEYSVDEKVSVSYRGRENSYGNIWKLVYGVNIYGNGKQKGGVPYICDDYNFAESKNTDNYKSAGFTVANVSGYVSAFGYSEEYDWLFMPSETLGNSSLPVGDYFYITSNLNGYRIALFGGGWYNVSGAGLFFWYLCHGVGGHSRDIGSRLNYIPV